jgi:diacylglycerol kinase
MKNNNLLKSFKYAFIGIFTSLKTERNLIIHTSIMLLVIIFGIIYKINTYEWFTCIILFITVLSSELFNTAIELTVDLACKEKHPLAKKAKDVAAGAVLITAIGSAIIGLWIFIPKIFNL